jgi:hypothetical protein
MRLIIVCMVRGFRISVSSMKPELSLDVDEDIAIHHEYWRVRRDVLQYSDCPLVQVGQIRLRELGTGRKVVLKM